MTGEMKVDNFLMRCWLETIQNIVGPNGLRSVLNFSHLEKYIDNFPPDNGKVEVPVKDPQVLFRSLYELFGQKGTRTLSLRAGREFARIAIEGRAGMAKALQIAARIVPETTRMRLVLEKAVEQHEKVYVSEREEPLAELQENDHWFLYALRDHWESEGIESNVPVCNVYLGLVQYLVEWITGKPHTVEEVKCRALGDPADVYKISKSSEE